MRCAAGCWSLEVGEPRLGAGQQESDSVLRSNKMTGNAANMVLVLRGVSPSLASARATCCASSAPCSSAMRWQSQHGLLSIS